MVGSEDVSLKRLLRAWWSGGKKVRTIANEDKVMKLPQPCYLYSITPEIAELLAWKKLRDGEKLLVYEVRELSWQEIRDVLESSSEAHPSSEEEP